MIGLRRSLGLSQAALAKRAGVSQAYIAKFESGTANPSIQKLSSLLRSLGIELRLEVSVAYAATPQDEPRRVPGTQAKHSRVERRKPPATMSA